MAGKDGNPPTGTSGDAVALSLTALRSPPLKDQVVGSLTRLIEDGTLAEGSRLPGERALAERLQVSRGTVREAVQFLEALGVVEIRHGSGTYVRDSSERSERSAKWRAWTSRHSERVHDLLEVRRGLEALAAELAAERGTDEDHRTLRQVLDRMEAAVEGDDVPLLVRLDVSFHHAIVEAAGNVALVELTNAMGAELLQERAATWDLEGRPARSLAEHRAIHDAIEARDVPRARAAVIEHLESIARDVEHIAATQQPAAAQPITAKRTQGRSRHAT